jgi:hypothetical protein
MLTLTEAATVKQEEVSNVGKHRVPGCSGKFSYGGKVRKSSKVIMVCQKCGAIEYV